MKNGKNINFKLKQIGIIRTPYFDNAPYQPVTESGKDFRIIIEPRYAELGYLLMNFGENGLIGPNVLTTL